MSVKFDCAGKVSLTEGGEAVIYERNNQVIKIYKPGINAQSKMHKVKMLISESLPKEVVKPLDIVVDRDNKFIGYSMNKIDGRELKELSSKKFATANNITTKDVLEMLVKIQNVIIELHKKGIFIGDLNDKNILFDDKFNIFFIDCDSWTIGSEKCEVAMDSFKDPFLRSNNFNASTDIYSFSIIVWKMLTRVHPFGGTMNPDINLIERMNKGISIIDNDRVVVPRISKTWKNLSPAFISSLKAIFETRNRESIDIELSDMLNNLKFCKNDKEYYYSKYSTCPLCDRNAKVRTKPVSCGAINNLSLYALLDSSKIKIIINEFTYLSIDDYIVDTRSNKKVKYQTCFKYYFMPNENYVEEAIDYFTIYSKGKYKIDKKYKTNIIVEENRIYYISRQNSFVEMTVLPQGNSIKNICKCSSNVYFEVSNKKYIVINNYFEKMIINNNGSNLEVPNSNDIINYGIHFDSITGKWLLVFEDSSGSFMTYVIKGNTIDFESNQIKYNCHLGGLSLNNNTIFIPMDGKIRGFSVAKFAFKDFECGIVNDESKLIKTKNKFTIVNDDNIYILN